MPKCSVLLIFPPALPAFQLVKKSVQNNTVSASIPLGIACLSAYLKKYSDTVVDAIDFTEIFANEYVPETIKPEDLVRLYLSKFLSNPPDIIGISAVYSTMFSNVLVLAEIIKEMFPKTYLIAGGTLATTLYTELFKHTHNIDAALYGEGEIPLLELVSADNKEEYVDKSNCWITERKILQDKETVFEQKFVSDYDSLPFPDYDLFDLQKYNFFSRAHKRHPDEDHETNFKVIKSIPVMFSRGCPFDCSFCVANKSFGRGVRAYSPSRVNDYIQMILDKYNCNSIVIEDNNLTFNKNWTLQILKILHDKKVNIDISNGVYVNSLDEEIIIALKDAGITILDLPIESGSENTLKLMNKKVDLEHAKKMFNLLHKHGIPTYTNIIIGYPGETHEDIIKSWRFIEEVGTIEWSSFAIATPFHGSRMYDLCIEKGYIDQDNFDIFNADKAIINTPEMTSEEVQFIFYETNLKYNFVYNYNMKVGNYKRAIDKFNNILNKIPEHAFALYFLCKCYINTSETDKANEAYSKYLMSITNNIEWKNWASHFALPDIAFV